MPRVLVVEDDGDLRSVLLRGLREEGFEASGVGSGAELLERIGPEAPNILIVDIGLPDADGRDVCQALRAQGLVARLHALLRRAGETDAVEIGALRLDPLSHAAFVGAAKIALTPTEFRLLAKLIAMPGQTVRRRELVQTGWPHGARVRDNTLDAYVARLRRKLGSHPAAPRIVTVHGVGYAIE